MNTNHDIDEVKTVRFFNIDYDLSNSDLTVKGEARIRAQLPNELLIDVNNEDDPEDVGADLISDETGWCVNSFDWAFVQS